MSQHTDRTGLYIMVFFCLLNSYSAATNAERTAKELKRIADAVLKQQQSIELRP